MTSGAEVRPGNDPPVEFYPLGPYLAERCKNDGQRITSGRRWLEFGPGSSTVSLIVRRGARCCSPRRQFNHSSITVQSQQIVYGLGHH